MHSSSSKFESFLNAVLLVINCILLITGLTVFLAIILFKYSGIIDAEKLAIEQAIIQQLIDVASVDEIAFALLALSTFLLILGTIGFYGTVRGKDARRYLILYFLLFAALSLSHMFAIILVGFKSSQVELNFRNKMDSKINELKMTSYDRSSKLFKNNCVIMKTLSNLFDCCGANSSNDLINENNKLDKQCCSNNSSKTGCTNKIVNAIKENNSILLVPICGLIVLEFMVTFAITFILGSINFEINDLRLRRKFSEMRNSI